MLKRYFYVIALRNNSNAVSDPNSNYRLASGQVRAETMDAALTRVKKMENVERKRDTRYSLRNYMEHFIGDNRVSVYVSPMADDETTKGEL